MEAIPSKFEAVPGIETPRTAPPKLSPALSIVEQPLRPVESGFTMSACPSSATLWNELGGGNVIKHGSEPSEVAPQVGRVAASGGVKLACLVNSGNECLTNSPAIRSRNRKMGKTKRCNQTQSPALERLANCASDRPILRKPVRWHDRRRHGRKEALSRLGKRNRNPLRDRRR